MIERDSQRGKGCASPRLTGGWVRGEVTPIVTISENWFSAELNMMVLSKTSDPRNGESITKLSNVSLAEPDPSLFMPPLDYTIMEQDQPKVAQ
jgi:hypothetical protein